MLGRAWRPQVRSPVNRTASRTDCWISALGNASMKRLKFTCRTAQTTPQEEDKVQSCCSCRLSRVRGLSFTGLSERPVGKRDKPF